MIILQVVVPRGPIKAKGLLLSCIRDHDPCVFLEPKTLYRGAAEEVPTKDFMLPLGKADILREGIYYFVNILDISLYIKKWSSNL